MRQHHKVQDINELLQVITDYANFKLKTAMGKYQPKYGCTGEDIIQETVRKILRTLRNNPNKVLQDLNKSYCKSAMNTVMIDLHRKVNTQALESLEYREIGEREEPSINEEVAFQEVELELLAENLSPLDKKIINLLMEGHSKKDIIKRLRIVNDTYQYVIERLTNTLL